MLVSLDLSQYRYPTYRENMKTNITGRILVEDVFLFDCRAPDTTRRG